MWFLTILTRHKAFCWISCFSFAIVVVLPSHWCSFTGMLYAFALFGSNMLRGQKVRRFPMMVFSVNGNEIRMCMRIGFEWFKYMIKVKINTWPDLAITATFGHERFRLYQLAGFVSWHFLQWESIGYTANSRLWWCQQSVERVRWTGVVSVTQNDCFVYRFGCDVLITELLRVRTNLHLFLCGATECFYCKFITLTRPNGRLKDHGRFCI